VYGFDTIERTKPKNKSRNNKRPLVSSLFLTMAQASPLLRPSREESLPALKRLFDMFDVNKDGVIDADDVITVLKHLRLHPPSGVVKRLIAEVDVKNDTVIDFDEFTVMRRNGSSAELNIVVEFRRFDVDELHRGYLTLESIMKVLKVEGYGVDEASQFASRLMAADSDADGKISFKDLHSYLTRRVPPEWADWVAENVRRGVADPTMVEILLKNGFDAEQARKLVADTRAVGRSVVQRSYADQSLSYIYTLRA
jgi:calmodulin